MTRKVQRTHAHYILNKGFCNKVMNEKLYLYQVRIQGGPGGLDPPPLCATM